MFTVSSDDLISEMLTLISHDSAHIRGRPTLKDSERFRTGSIIHESAKNTFGYVKTCLKNCQKIKKCYTKNAKKCHKINTKAKNTTQTNLQKLKVYSNQSNVHTNTSCTVDEHVVSIAANRRNVDNVIWNDQIKISNL